jgi:hypothetical protein
MSTLFFREQAESSKWSGDTPSRHYNCLLLLSQISPLSVLGVEVSLQDGQGRVALNGSLVDRGSTTTDYQKLNTVSLRFFRFGTDDTPDYPLLHAVDLEVIKLRSQVAAQTTRSPG